MLKRFVPSPQRQSTLAGSKVTRKSALLIGCRAGATPSFGPTAMNGRKILTRWGMRGSCRVARRRPRLRVLDGAHRLVTLPLGMSLTRYLRLVSDRDVL